MDGLRSPIPLPTCDAALTRALELGDVRAEAWCRLLRGDAYNRELMLARAAGELSQAITLFSAIDDPEGTAISLWRKGSVWCRIGDLDNGRLILSQGLEIARTHGLRLIEGVCLSNLAFTWGSEGHASQFRELTERALEIFDEIDDVSRKTLGFCNLGGALSRLGELDAATDAYLQARSLVQPDKQPLVHALIEGGLGEIAMIRGDLEEGTRRITGAAEFLRTHRLFYDAVRQDVLLARGYSLCGRVQESIELYRKALEEARERGYSAIQMQALHSIARMLGETGKWEEAYKTLKEAWELKDVAINEESKQRFEVLRDVNLGTAIAQDRLKANELAEINKKLSATLAELDQANLRLEELAKRDPLTKALNRYGFETAAAPLLGALSNSQGLGVLWVDVNDFKSINDTWGHGVGDEVLIEIARRLKVAARETDVVSRFGGDEFVVLIADVHEVDAVFVSERFKRELTSAPVSTSLGPVKVGVSLGLSSVYSADDLERAMLRADSFMYQDKRGTGSWHAVDPDTISIAMEESEILKD